ncbi:MAG: hypothetical protein EOO99_00080 [Pedobacter sp.]|nr:MAG: hypothetical protein EOO99_00080 [Pedobacter sp.]
MKRFKRAFYIGLFLLGVLSSCKKDNLKPDFKEPEVPYVQDRSFKIVAYMPDYKNPNLIGEAKYKMITHLNYAFLKPNPIADGSLLTLTNPSYFNILKEKSRLYGLKFGISVAGAESIFVAICSNPTTRETFIRNIVTFAKSNQLAGVDMDWEYPRTSNSQPNADYTAFMKSLAKQLHASGMYLSAAITPAVYTSTNKEAISPELYNDVDFFNIMQYDGAGYDTAEPLNHAPLKLTENSLNFWLETKGMPKHLAVLGMPLYGRSSTGSIGYRDIEASGADVMLNVARVNGVDYGFNGIALVKAKTAIALQRCNGIMFWEFAHDSNTNNSLIKAANDQLGRTY